MAQNVGFTLWFTGMLGSGKTTLANYIAARLRQVGRAVEILDEDEVGEVLWQRANDTKEERNIAVRRLGLVASMLSRNNVATIVASTSPYKQTRDEVRRLNNRYVEVFIDCPTEVLIKRDTTGRYKKALGGELPNFIGITEPYEPPNAPEVTIQSAIEPVEEGARKIFQALLDLGLVSGSDLLTITGKKMKANPLPKKSAKPAGKEKNGKAARPARAERTVAKAAPAAKKGSAKKAR
jgi:adenylylsulfate kinase